MPFRVDVVHRGVDAVSFAVEELDVGALQGTSLRNSNEPAPSSKIARPLRAPA